MASDYVVVGFRSRAELVGYPKVKSPVLKPGNLRGLPGGGALVLLS